MRQIDYLIDQYGNVVDSEKDTFSTSHQNVCPSNTKIVLTFWTGYTQQGDVTIPTGNISSLSGISGTILVQYKTAQYEPEWSDIPGGLIDISKNWVLKPVDAIGRLKLTCTDIVGVPYIQVQTFGGI